jgi:hypothetical protein
VKRFARVALVLALGAGCAKGIPRPDGGAGGSGAGGNTGNWVTFTVPAVNASLDVLFMVDNSSGMDLKQNALAQSFSQLIQQAQQLPGGLPDLHIGVISSDMGAGSEPIGQDCKRVLGDRGLLYGNDPKNSLASVAPSADPAQGGHPDPSGCGLGSGQRWISDIANPNGTGRITNYYGSIQDVFSCLAKAVGTSGCRFEHQLQSLRVALNADYPDNPKDTPNQINPENIGFVRPYAYLGIVLITDEDDCSADPDDYLNDAMFLQTQNPTTETTSLRCATRGHICNGQAIPGYQDPSVGYQPPNPLPQPNLGFSTAFANCAPKDQPNPASPAHSYLPLIRVQDMIDSVNGVSAWAVDANGNYVYDGKGSHVSVQKTPDKILVSGIIGWPPDPNTNLNGIATSNLYQIGIDTSSLPAPQNTYWDYLPICQIPSMKSSDGNLYKAYGGLRLKRFIDAFGANGQVFSMCSSSFFPAMAQIGASMLSKIVSGCLGQTLPDSDPNTLGFQTSCQVKVRVPCSGTTTCPASGFVDTPVSQCSSSDPVYIPDSERPCWVISTNTTNCPGAANQRIDLLWRNGTIPAQGTLLALTCPR